MIKPFLSSTFRAKRSEGSVTELLKPLALATALACSLQAHAADAPAAPAAAPAECDPYKNYECLDKYLGDGILERFVNAYILEQGHDAAPVDPKAPPGRRDDFPPAALPTPPMPFTEWPYGGTEALGATLPASIDSPFMTAIANTSVGKWMADNHLQTYGWVNVGANFSTSEVEHGGNSPAAYLYNPNAISLDQVVLYLDRFPDTVQKDHVDWGMRLSGIYGTNYRYTTGYGYSSGQLLQHNLTNGYDYPMVWGELYFPQVRQGLMVRAGRFIAVPDIEAQLAPNNYMYTHSMTYTFDNYTTTGVIGSLSWDKNWIFQFGVIDGTEASLAHLHGTRQNQLQTVPASAGFTYNGQNTFTNPLYPNSTFPADPGSMASFVGCARWNADDGANDVQVCFDGQNRGTWGYNNLEWTGMTFYHKFNDKWHMSWEAYHEWTLGVPNVNNPLVAYLSANNGTPFGPANTPYNPPNQAVCENATVLTCRSDEYGTVAYFNYSPDNLNNFSIRPERYWDSQGQRTGTRAVYTNFALGWQHWYSPQIEVRPEIAYYHANQPAFNGYASNPYGLPGVQNQAPNRKEQMVLSGDVIWHF
jgi:hypothetical protein